MALNNNNIVDETGAPFPNVDPDGITADVRDDWGLPTDQLWFPTLQFMFGFSRNETTLALYNAADDDVGTGGPDLVRGIYPTAKVVNSSGITDVADQQIRGIYDGLIATRRSKEN